MSEKTQNILLGSSGLLIVILAAGVYYFISENIVLQASIQQFQ